MFCPMRTSAWYVAVDGAVYSQPMHNFPQMSFDMYCPSVSSNLDKRICHQCGQYFPSQAAKCNHSRIHRHASAATVDDADDVEANTATVPSAGGSSEPTDSVMPVVRNLSDWLQSAFADDD